MKKISIIIALMLTTLMLSGCIATAGIVATAAVGGAAEVAIKGGVEKLGDMAWEAAVEAPRRQRILEGRDNPFNNEPEERLLRRTSDIAGGTPVDITAYLLHDDSFQIVDGNVKRNKASIDVKATKDLNSDVNTVFEFGADVTFEANKQPYQVSLNIATIEATEAKAKSFVNSNIWNGVARKYGLKAGDIKKRSVQFTTTRYGKARFPFIYKALFVSEAEPCYYQFDVEAEYQKSKAFVLTNSKIQDYSTFNKVYRSDLQNITAAAVDVQASIWMDAKKVGIKDLPMPRVNVVQAERFNK